jgi:hypothetical protein
MSQQTCERCRQPLTPILPGQTVHPLCSRTATGWIPRQPGRDGQAELPGLTTDSAVPRGLQLALRLAGLGWHILPLSPASKRPLANCPACTADAPGPPHPAGDCPCRVAGRWCHGVRAATTSPDRLAAWWQAEPAAVPGVAAGPSGLVLIDIDNHGDQLPSDLATGLLPSIDLAAEPIPRELWDDPARYRDGRDALRLLGAVRGGHQPWPPGEEHQPVAVATPSGGRHLWYQAPTLGLHQVLADPAGRHGLAWQVDIKAGWSYGLAPGATTAAGTYRVLSSDSSQPGQLPRWLAAEVIRVAKPQPDSWRAAPGPAPLSRPDHARAAYLVAVIRHGAARLAGMDDGRKRALAALAYQAGGLIAWSGLPPDEVASQLADIGTASGLPAAAARRIVTRSLSNGRARPLAPRPVSDWSGRAP